MVFFIASLALAPKNSDHQLVAIPTERSEGGSQSAAPLPVADEGAALCVQRSVSEAAARRQREHRAPQTFAVRCQGLHSTINATTLPQLSLVQVQQGKPENGLHIREVLFSMKFVPYGTSEILLRNMKYASRMKYACGI